MYILCRYLLENNKEQRINKENFVKDKIYYKKRFSAFAENHLNVIFII